MRILVSLEFDEGDRLDALYLLHFVNDVRVDLDVEHPNCVLDLSYFHGRYVTPAGDMEPRVFTNAPPDEKAKEGGASGT
jgi:hypothetical protein